VPSLPPDTFLTVNVSPHLLGSAPVQDALATRPDLRRVVVELTEHTPVHDLAALRRQTEELRARGALIALVLVGEQGEPIALLLADQRTAEVYTAPVSLRVHPTTDIGEALQRALTRPPAQRFDPVICTDPSGHVLGLLRVEDLASAALTSSDPGAPASGHCTARPRRQGVHP
jgi:hypothetical protein